MVKLAVSAQSSAVLFSNGRVACWGDGSYGHCPGSHGGVVHAPVWAAGVFCVDDFYFQGFGIAHDVDGTLWTWGAAESAQRGGITNFSYGQVTRVETWDPTRGVELLGGGNGVTLVGTTSGELYWWGTRRISDVPLQQETTSIPLPVGLPARTESMATGLPICVAAGGKVYCWGPGSQGALGNGSESNLAEPTVVDGLPSVRKVDGDNRANCVLTNDDEVWCWGDNDVGLLGRGPTIPELPPTEDFDPVPKRVEGIPPARDLAVGLFLACIVTHADRVYCWGWRAGSLGDFPDGVIAPTEVLFPFPVKAIAPGAFHVCVLTYEDEVWCQGEIGMLGRDAPTRELGRVDFSALLSGSGP